MANIGQLGLTAAMAVVVGVVLGRMTAPEPQAAVVPASAGGTTAETKKPAEPAKIAKTIDAPRDADAPKVRERLQACEADLAEAEKLHSILATPFPPAGVETPGAWQTMVHKCDVTPWELVEVDCAEYPCFVGFRRPADAGPLPAGSARAKERLEVEATLRGCDAVKAALGDGFDEGAVAAAPVEATCGGKTEWFWGAVVLDPKGPAFEIVNDDDETAREAGQLLRWADRRAAALRARWPCAT